MRVRVLRKVKNEKKACCQPSSHVQCIRTYNISSLFLYLTTDAMSAGTKPSEDVTIKYNLRFLHLRLAGRDFPCFLFLQVLGDTEKKTILKTLGFLFHSLKLHMYNINENQRCVGITHCQSVHLSVQLSEPCFYVKQKAVETHFTQISGMGV